MTEITMLSGKGGTGKTSLSAAFATLDKNIVAVDCDVESANLYLILNPENYNTSYFKTGVKAIINYNNCLNCGLCIDYCRFNAISYRNGKVTISEISCDGCELCSHVCPNESISMIPQKKSCWYEGNYRNGKMVYARLAPGEENSGKLVNIVRSQARLIAKETNSNYIIIDGPPGIGCPAISSVTGAHKAIIVTEPSLTGFHDMKRILELVSNFKIESFVVINKYDINEKITRIICEWCNKMNTPVIGKIPFDEQLVNAMIHCKSINEWLPDSPASKEIISIWNYINFGEK